MARSESKEFRGLANSVLLFTVFAIVIAALDFGGSVRPWSPTVAGWRYEVAAALPGYLAIPILALVAGAFAAFYLERPKLAQKIMIACYLVAGALVIAWIVYLIDGFGLRAAAKPSDRGNGDVGLVVNSIKLLAYGAALVVTARGLARSGVTTASR